MALSLHSSEKGLSNKHSFIGSPSSSPRHKRLTPPAACLRMFSAISWGAGSAAGHSVSVCLNLRFGKKTSVESLYEEVGWSLWEAAAQSTQTGEAKQWAKNSKELQSWVLTPCGFTLGVTLLIYTFVNIKIKEISSLFTENRKHKTLLRKAANGLPLIPTRWKRNVSRQQSDPVSLTTYLPACPATLAHESCLKEICTHPWALTKGGGPSPHNNKDCPHSSLHTQEAKWKRILPATIIW